jgi:alpha/beta superfamily hydrolase
MVPAADHFFGNQLPELRTHVEDYLSKNLLRSSLAVNQ